MEIYYKFITISYLIFFITFGFYQIIIFKNLKKLENKCFRLVEIQYFAGIIDFLTNLYILKQVLTKINDIFNSWIKIILQGTIPSFVIDLIYVFLHFSLDYECRYFWMINSEIVLNYILIRIALLFFVRFFLPIFFCLSHIFVENMVMLFIVSVVLIFNLFCGFYYILIFHELKMEIK